MSCGPVELEHCLITTQDVASISVSFPLGGFSSHHLKLPDIYTCICLLSVSFTAGNLREVGILFVLLTVLPLGMRTLLGSW